MTDKTALKTAFLILGIVIGAGFASGKELVAFFLDYGAVAGFLTVLIGLLIYYLIFIFIRIGKYIKPKTITNITTAVFKQYSKLVDAIILFSMFFAVFAMLAGADALAGDVFVDYSFPYLSIVLSFLVVIIVLGGIKSLLQVNSIIVPLIVALVIIVSVGFLVFGNLGSPAIDVGLNFVNIGMGIFSMLLYTSMNLFMVGIIISQMGAIIKKKTAIKISLYASVLITVCVGLALLAILNSSNVIVNANMPMVIIAYSLSEFIGGLYSLIVLFGIFTTLIAASFALDSWLRQFIKDKLLSISIIITSAFLVSRLGFSNIVRVLYPVEGLFAFIFIFGIIVYYYKHRKEIDKLD